MIPNKHFFMIRHGETEANAAKTMAGSTDSPLTVRGIEQAETVHQVMDHIEIKPQKIIHSNLSRARDTATIINQALNLPLHEDADYAEMDAGDWEGVLYTQCRPLMQDWLDAPGGETRLKFFQRVKRAKIKAMQHPEEPIMAVCHGGVFRAFLGLYDIHIDGVQNCKLYEFVPSHNEQNFPWNVWRYDLDGHNVNKTPVKFCSQNPKSEILLNTENA